MRQNDVCALCDWTQSNSECDAKPAVHFCIRSDYVVHSMGVDLRSVRSPHIFEALGMHPNWRTLPTCAKVKMKNTFGW